MSSYQHLSNDERDRIAVWKAAGLSRREIARRLKRNVSTVTRELQRNAPPIRQGYYLPHKAHHRAVVRKSQAHRRIRLKSKTIRSYTREKLALGWSPEQIAGRLSQSHPGLSISSEAIYQWIYGEAKDLIPCLTRAHRKRFKRGHSRKHRKPHIPERTPLTERPEFIEKRKQSGHWEADTAVSRQSTSTLLVAVERKSRFAKIHKMPSRHAAITQRTLSRSLSCYPVFLRRTITYDNGTENTLHLKVNRKLGTRSYFCAPFHSWEKGTVENTIGLIRRLLPKKTDFRYVTHQTIRAISRRLNDRPRKCLNFKTPAEVFCQSVALNH